MNNVSICIPKVNKGITKPFIYKTINSYCLGKIKKINLIRKPDNTQRAYIHYAYLNNNPKALYVKELLETKKDFKIIYNAPWYWKCFILNDTYGYST